MALPLTGQGTKAELLGVVRDPTGLPVAGAVAELTSLTTRMAFRQETTEVGPIISPACRRAPTG